MTLVCISAIVAALLAGLAVGLAIGVRIGAGRTLAEARGRGKKAGAEALHRDKPACAEGEELAAARTEGAVEAPCGALAPEGEVPVADREQVERLMAYIDEQLRRPELSVEELSEYMNMSRVHLYRKVKAATGRTPIELIRVLRLRRACRLLKDQRYSVAEVAEQVGFNTPRIFSRYFREEYGVVPSKSMHNS